MANVNEEIGARIAKIRKAKSLKQSDLAGALKLTAAAVGNYERGQRVIPAEVINRAAEFFNVPTWLISEGVPDSAPDNYTIEYFANASKLDWQNYYSEMHSIESAEYFAQLYEDMGENHNFIKNTSADLLGLQESDALKQLAQFAAVIRTSVTNAQRVEKSSDNKKIQEFDPFAEEEARRAEDLKHPYTVYFGKKHLNSRLNDTIEKVKDNISNEDLKVLQEALEQINREKYMP